MTKAFFYDLQHINGGGSRPGRLRRAGTPRKVAVLGAGMMGAGIAYVLRARRAGTVVLKDVSLEAAEQGKGYSERLVAKGVKRGRTTLETGEALLERITPTADYNDLAGCDMVIEAVFESAALKQEVFAAGDEDHRAGRAAVLQHLDAADHRAGRRASTARATSSACTSSRRSTRCRWSRSSAASGPPTPRWPRRST